MFRYLGSKVCALNRVVFCQRTLHLKARHSKRIFKKMPKNNTGMQLQIVRGSATIEYRREEQIRSDALYSIQLIADLK